MTVRQIIFNFLTALAMIAVPIQCLIEPSAVNIMCSCIVAASSVATLSYLRFTTALKHHPLSSIAIFGLCVSSQFGALVVQTAYLTSLVKSLYDPLFTFSTLAFYQAIALATHSVFRFFSRRRRDDARPGLIRGLLSWAGLYRIPSSGMLWYLGIMGLPSLVLAHFEGLPSKIATGFMFLAWAPFLISFYAREIGPSYCNVRRNRYLLAGYVLIVAVLGLALNARGVVFAGLATLALLYLLAGMRSEVRVTRRALLTVVAAALVLMAISGPASDLATSMAVARRARATSTPLEMIESTLHIWGQPRLIEAYRADQREVAQFQAYDEYYIENPILARLIETKFYDNSFHYAGMLSSDSAYARLRDISIELAWADLPSPLLKRMGIGVDKKSLENSMGDYLAYLSRGVPLGGHKTGQMFAQGIALFGPFFPCLYALICLALFAVMDLLTIPGEGPAALCTLGMLQIWTFFMGGITYESLHKMLALFVRTFAQMVLIYSVLLLPAWTFRRRPEAAPISGPAMSTRTT